MAVLRGELGCSSNRDIGVEDEKIPATEIFYLYVAGNEGKLDDAAMAFIRDDEIVAALIRRIFAFRYRGSNGAFNRYCWIRARHTRHR